MAKKIPVETIVDIYNKKGCNVTATCTSLGISRKTFYDWRNTRKGLSDALDEVDESVLDYAESKLVEHINNNDLQALIFFLRTKGKKRGYVEKTESDVNINAFEKLMKETE